MQSSGSLCGWSSGLAFAGGRVDDFAGRLVGGVESRLGALVAHEVLVDTVAEQGYGLAQVGGQGAVLGLGIGDDGAGRGLLLLEGGEGGGQLGKLLRRDALLLKGGEVGLGLVVDVFGDAGQVVVGGAQELLFGVVGVGVEADVVGFVGVGEQGGGHFGGALGEQLAGGLLDGARLLGFADGLLGGGGGRQVGHEVDQLEAGGGKRLVGGVEVGVVGQDAEGGLQHGELRPLLIIHTI